MTRKANASAFIERLLAVPVPTMLSQASPLSQHLTHRLTRNIRQPKSRPWNLNVSLVWSTPRRFRMVACKSWIGTESSTTL